MVNSLPGNEGYGFDDSGLDDFLSGEHTPSYSIRTFAVCIGPQVTLLIDSVVGDPRVSFDTSNEGAEQFGRHKEFKIRL